MHRPQVSEERVVPFKNRGADMALVNAQPWHMTFQVAKKCADVQISALTKFAQNHPLLVEQCMLLQVRHARDITATFLAPLGLLPAGPMLTICKKVKEKQNSEQLGLLIRREETLSLVPRSTHKLRYGRSPNGQSGHKLTVRFCTIE